ncbi:MAG: hypothetical protein JSU70_02865 [Phycisphaerales bacterium]|nr:MAG: hypothetical protein JSU70_02865 [Phycisphaerales bacterium]
MSVRAKHLVAGTWASCLVAFVLVYSFVLLPQARLIEAKEQGLAGVGQPAVCAERAGQDEAAARLRKQIETSTERLRDFVVDRADSAKVVSDISRISDAIGLGSFSIANSDDDNLSPAWVGQTIGEKCINISFAGSYNKFATFLNALERRRPVVFVDTFKITRSALGTSNHKVNMRLPILVEDSPERTVSAKSKDSDNKEETRSGANDVSIIEFGTGVGPIKFGMLRGQVIQLLGKPDRINGNGSGLSYALSRGITMAVSPYRGVLIIDCWSRKIKPITFDDVSDFTGATKEGIRMNATREQILAAYGQPDETTLKGPTTTLHYAKLRAQFTLLGGQLVNLRIFAPGG